MKEIRRNMRLIGTLILCLFIGTGGWFGYAAFTQGSRWAMSGYNTRLNNAKKTVAMGSITDRDGYVLAYTDAAGERQYSSDMSIRLAVSQTVGDTMSMSGTGVQTFFASALVGMSGSIIDRTWSWLSGETTRGDDIQLTIDAQLSGVIARSFPSGYNGAAVVMNYKTGEVLAMVSMPEYDPAGLGTSVADTAYLNRCLQGLYTPGSVFKIVTLTAALREVYGDAVRVVEKPSREELAAADVVLLSTGTIDVESFERPFALPKEEEAFIRTAVESNPNTIVLVNSGSGIRMGGWNDKAAAVIYGWYPGQSGFTALADILSGKLSPSGKLPMTIEKEFNDSPAKGTMPAGAEFYNKAPRAYNERLIQLYDIDYKESVLVGYRWYETKGIAPLYPFGFGLSYTTFELSKPRAPKAFPADKPLKVSVTLTNTGDREGAEVVQLYVTENAPTVLRPKKELKGFRKVTLAPGKSAVVEFELDRQALAFWDTQSRGWKVNPGEYTLSLGTSSADIAATLPVSVK